MGSRRKHDVRFRDSSCAAMDDGNADFVRAQFDKRVGNGFKRALNVGFEDKIKNLRFTVVRRACKERFKGNA